MKFPNVGGCRVTPVTCQESRHLRDVLGGRCRLKCVVVGLKWPRRPAGLEVTQLILAFGYECRSLDWGQSDRSTSTLALLNAGETLAKACQDFTLIAHLQLHTSQSMVQHSKSLLEHYWDSVRG